MMFCHFSYIALKFFASLDFFVFLGTSTGNNDDARGECILPMDVGTVEDLSSSAQNQAEPSDSVASLPGKF